MSEAKKTYLSKIQLKAELDRCLNCKNQPCMHACPVNCNPQEFINHAKQGAYGEAVKTITRTNPMGQTCGLICPDKFCMQACTRSRIDFAVNIPKVQATILENFRNDGEDYSQTKPKGKNVAVIGAGPAGIAAASLLAKSGYEVNIFEAGNQIGGALNMIPDARLPHDVIEKDWKFISNTPLIRLHLNARVGDVRPLLMQYDGVIIATGEPNTAQLNIEGEELCLSHMEYLHHPERYATSGRVAVIGGGMVGCETAEYLAARGCKVSVIEMMDKIAAGESTTILPTLLENYKTYGVEQYPSHKVKEFRMDAVVCENKDGAEVTIPCDYIVLAMGARSNEFDAAALEAASIPVYSIGDAAGKAADISNAIRTGYDTACQL